MYYVYMIKSATTGRHYYGYSSDLEKRLLSHNSSQNRFTRGKGPWNLIGYQECQSKGEAMAVEQKLKNMKNPARAYSWLKRHGAVR